MARRREQGLPPRRRCVTRARRVRLSLTGGSHEVLTQDAVAGHVVVLPREHALTNEQVPDAIVGHMFQVVNKVGMAVFEAIGAQGTNVLVQNGVAAGQTQNHSMIHVIPRFENDGAQIGWQPKQGNEEELSTLELQFKEHTKSVGIFKKEKPKPIEFEAPEEASEEDYRVKHLRRIP